MPLIALKGLFTIASRIVVSLVDSTVMVIRPPITFVTGLPLLSVLRFRKSEISELERMGLVPMVNEYSKVMAFSAKTLFNGDNLGLQTYSVVRVFDYITKVLIDFLNRRAFENWTTRTEADLRGQVVKFLDSVMGPNKLIERFKVMKIE